MITNYLQHNDPMEAFSGLFFIVSLFGIVVLHELGHALTARRFGIRTRDITLLPIGGVARLERIPEDPRQELVIALAGPAVNAVIAGVLCLGLLARGSLLPMNEALSRRRWILPADALGERHPCGFQLAAGVSDGRRQGVGGCLASGSITCEPPRSPPSSAREWRSCSAFWNCSNPLLIFIALFVWVAGAQEAGLVQLRSALGGIAVMRVMIKDFQSLRPDDPLSEAIAHVLAGFQQDFPVVDDGRLVGMLTRNELASALGRHGPDTPVADVMHREFTTADPRHAPGRLLEASGRPQPESSRGQRRQRRGILTAENLAEVLLVQDALRQGHRPPMFSGERPARDLAVPSVDKPAASRSA